METTTMKKVFHLGLIVLLTLVTSSVYAQRRGGNGEGMRRSGNFGFNRMRQNPRAEAEKKLKELYPKEYAEVQKLRDDAEKKLQELAKKANITLPELPKSMSERMEELKKKYPKEMAEYEELQKTDRRAAWAKLRALMEKEGIGFGPRGENRQNAAMRENPNRKLKEVQKKYPEEWKKIQEIRRTDPAKARTMTRELLQKYEKESKK